MSACRDLPAGLLLKAGGVFRIGKHDYTAHEPYFPPGPYGQAGTVADWVEFRSEGRPPVYRHVADPVPVTYV